MRLRMITTLILMRISVPTGDYIFDNPNFMIHDLLTEANKLF